MKKVFKHFICGASSIALFFILFFIANLSAILSAVPALLAFFLCSGFLPSERGKGTTEQKNNATSNIGEAIEYGVEKLSAIEKKSFEIENRDVRAKIGRIYSLGQKILDDIRENPNDFSFAHQFFSYYLDTTNTILEKYVSIQKNREFLSIADESFQRTEKLLDTIETVYQKQLEKLYEDDVMDLDTELKVLAKTIKTEGF
jgi:5-bromo-4-chloroindolyl phosphate hydrolysis protein